MLFAMVLSGDKYAFFGANLVFIVYAVLAVSGVFFVLCQAVPPFSG
jgi:hypothetical protein